MANVEHSEPTSSNEDDTRPVEGQRAASSSASLNEIEALGRYVVLEEAGQGGMGRVYRAYDPKLQREVALKVLKMEDTQSADMARILREAQAMAQLSHPNVVPVYDVDQSGSSVFISMEYVAGKTLRDWSRSAWRSVPEVLDVYCAAGRGLAAAHDAGVLHRDFKPANAILGDDGRVRVMDFGLARGLDGSEPIVPPQAMGGSGSVHSLSDPLTEAGHVMGTPAYMAPEQFKRPGTDASTDQYAFCVALFEALYNQRPFRPGVEAKANKDLIVPEEHDVPPWLLRIIERGLEPKPENRWPSMNALLEALADDPQALRRRRLTVAVGGVALVGLGALASTGLQDAPEPCTGARAQLDDAWSDPQRAAVAEAFGAVSIPYAAWAADQVSERLDAYADAWVAAHEDACRATEVRREQSADLLDARMRCLEERKDVLAALVVTLGEADASVVLESVTAVDGLPAIGPCSDPKYVTAQVRPPEDPTTAERVADLRLTLARARALELTGRYDQAQVDVDAVANEAADLAYQPLAVEAALERGMLLERAGKYEESVEELERAFFDARKTGQDEIRVRAALRLLIVVGDRLGRHDEGRQWGAHARAEIEVAGREDDEADLLSNLGLVALAAGEPQQALEHHQKAYDLRREALGENDARVAISLNNLAGAKHGLGDYTGAEEGFRAALEIRKRALGPDHPDVATSHANVATAASAIGKLDEAQRDYETGLGILVRAFGDDHPLVATTTHNLGIVHLQRGELEKAEELFVRGLEIRRRVLPPDHPHMAVSLSTLSAALMPQKKFDEAIEALEGALEIQTKVLGPDHPDLAATLNNLGNAYFQLAQYERSLELHRRNVAVREAGLGPDHPKVAMSLANLGRTLSALHRGKEAVAALERARAIQDGVEGQLAIRITIYGYLAEALFEAGRREESIDVATKARELGVKDGASEEDLAPIDALLTRARKSNP